MKALWAVLAAVLAMTGTAILGDLVSEEVRGRLDHLPHALIRLAARRLPPDVREDLAEEWTAELHEILHGAEALPVTRLYRGTRYALGLLRTASSIGRDLSITATTTAAARTGGIPRPFTAAVVRVLVHRAIFLPASPEHYFMKVTNLSASREVEITHLWFETNPPVHVLNPDRPLPTRLRLDETFETWVPVAAVPNVPNVERLGRVLLSNGKVVKS
jgi:hypothetical protein